MDKMRVTYEALLGLAAELVLDDAIRNYQREKLQHGIDQALATGDEDTFYCLTTQLNDMQQL